MFVLLVTIVSCLLIFIVLRYMYLRINTSVPTIPNALSLTEIYGINFKELFKRVIYIGEYTNELGGLTKFICGIITTYVVSTPEDAVVVLTKCMEKMFLYSTVEPIFGKVLVTAPVNTWKRNRRLLDISFKQKILDGYINIYNQQARALVSSMSKKINEETDFYDIFLRNILETVCKTTLGTSDKEAVTEEYIKGMDKMLKLFVERSKRPWLLLDFVFKWTALKKEQDEAEKVVKSFSERMIMLRKSEFANKMKGKHVTTKDTTIRSCLEVLIETMEKEELLSDMELRQLMNNVMIGGFHTTVPQVILALICIGSHPEVERKLYDEIIKVTSEEDGYIILKEDLQKMSYLDAVLKETLRLYAVAPVVARNTTEQIKLQNHLIPADCPVIVHLWALNRNKAYWGIDAEHFRPERWLDGSAPAHPAAFASFSAGRRNCIGKSSGMTLMKVLIINVVKKFKIIADHRKLDFEFVIVLKPVAGQMMKIELR